MTKWHSYEGRAAVDMSRVFGWLSYSHWGMFRLPLFTCPDWFADGAVDDDDLVERISADHDLAYSDPVAYNQFI